MSRITPFPYPSFPLASQGYITPLSVTSTAVQPAPYPTYHTNPYNTPQAKTNSTTDSLGVHVHFFKFGDGRPLVNDHDLDMIRMAGFRTVRMDILWSEVEKQPGVFDFRKYDWAINGLLKRGIRPMVILGLGNSLYTKGLSIQPPQAQLAFERYAKETVQHFKGKGLIYELVNEPNKQEFWQPQPNVNEYMQLANRLLPQLKQIDPQAFIAAPSTAGAPLDFLEACFQRGLLNIVDGVTIHPHQSYRPEPNTNWPPESFEQEYQQTRALMDRYSPPYKKIPLLLGEWGFSSANGELDEQTQANYLVRQALLGMMHGTPVNIWYDWKSDIAGGANPFEKEDNFGVVSPQRQPKAAYYAMQELVNNLKDHGFVRQIPAPVGDYILEFSPGIKLSPYPVSQRTLVSWTTREPHTIKLIGPNKQPIRLTLTQKPQYSHPL